MSNDSKGIGKLQQEAQRSKVSEIPAKQFMNRNVVTIRQGTKIYSAVQTLATHRISGAPVVDNGDRLVGVITEYDLLLQTATQDVLDQIKFTRDPVTIDPEAKLKDIIVIFFKKRVRWLPVVAADKRVEGVVTRVDVLNKLLSKGK